MINELWITRDKFGRNFLFNQKPELLGEVCIHDIGGYTVPDTSFYWGVRTHQLGPFGRLENTILDGMQVDDEVIIKLTGRLISFDESPVEYHSLIVKT